LAHHCNDLHLDSID
jgi:hypothetical protein